MDSSKMLFHTWSQQSGILDCTNAQLFYSHYEGQPVLADTPPPVENYRILLMATSVFGAGRTGGELELSSVVNL